MPTHIVGPGETISSIAEDYSLAGWHRIYDHPNNAAFRQKRPNPNVIFPGDEIFVPDLELRIHQAPTDQLHRYVLHKPEQWLRIVVKDHDDRPLATVPYELKVGSRLCKGKTDGNGLLQEEIELKSSAGLLTIGDLVFELSIGDLNPMDQTPDLGVSGAQGRLRNLGYPVGPIDGLMGPKTTQAIRFFQADEHLTVTGELDGATFSQLVKVHGV